MTDAERISRLELVLKTLISFLHRELGSQAARQLFDVLDAKEVPPGTTLGENE
jgi:hypothetical protein